MMNGLPEARGSYERLCKIFMAPLTARLMMTAIELRVFDQLTEFRSAEDVAQGATLHPGNTRRFLDALATIDLVEKKDGLYRNLPEAQMFLTEGGPYSVGALFRMMQRICIDPLDDMLHLVQKGPAEGAEKMTLDNVADWAQMARDSAAWAFGEMGVMVAEELSRLPGFQGFEKMLDLGGGPGVFALYAVDAHPSMKAVVFDRPAVVEVAKEFIDQYAMAERVSVAGGDYLTDDIGAGYDLIWACSTLNCAGANLEPLFGKIHAALKPGGYFAAFQDGMTHENTKPDTMLGHLAGSMTTGVDASLEQGYVADLMLRCGFRSVRSRTIDTPMGAMDLDLARK